MNEQSKIIVDRIKFIIVAAIMPLFIAESLASQGERDTFSEEMVVYTAKKIITMEPALPIATAVAVADGRIVSVGTLETLSKWIEARGARIDRTFENKIIMPGFIDPHVHPSLPTILTHFPFIAPDDWSLPTGEFPGATTPAAYIARLKELVAQHSDDAIPFITWGYHPLWHGELFRQQLNQLFPEKPVLLWHRSFHELIGNDAAFELLGVTDEDVAGVENIDWENGHFYEGGLFKLVAKMPFIYQRDRFAKGMQHFVQMVHQGGVTTALDMGTGLTGQPKAEIELIRHVAESSKAPARFILTPIISDFINRGVSIEQAKLDIDSWREGNSQRVIVDRRFKIMMDGAIYSGLAQFGFPGYLDGHKGVWMHPLETTQKWAQAFWDADYQLHAHTNGDASATELIQIVKKLQKNTPRNDHRTTLEHFAYTTEDQNRKLKELGIQVSANPYYHYILSDIYSDKWLGQDRAQQMVRLGSLERLGVPFTLHSDSPMAPLEPLTLVSAAVNRITINGNVSGAEERVTLEAALRAITIDAAWIMGWEDQIGSIRAGKRADFTVLEADPYKVNRKRIKDIKIWGTVFEGNVAPLGT